MCILVPRLLLERVAEFEHPGLSLLGGHVKHGIKAQGSPIPGVKVTPGVLRNCPEHKSQGHPDLVLWLEVLLEAKLVLELHVVPLEGVTGPEQLEVTGGWEPEAGGVEDDEAGERGQEDTEERGPQHQGHCS